MPTRVLFLAGAPDTNSLEWDETGLVIQFQSPMRRFLGDADIGSAESALTAASCSLAKWRYVSLTQRKEVAAMAAQPSQWESNTFVSFHNDDDDNHLHFLEHSLAILQDIDCSQIGHSAEAVMDNTAMDESTNVTLGSLGTLLSTDSEFQTSPGSLGAKSSEDPAQQIFNFSGQVTDLQHIPNARHLKAIHPQTMTVNVLASVISVQPNRTVRLRKSTGEMEIVEVLLGDETKAGFTTTFWLTPEASQNARPPASPARQHGIREALGALRSGDTLLLTHIALSEFNNNVFGQSLRLRTTRNNTTLTVLSDGVIGLSAPLLAKGKRVKEWAGQFIGHGAKRAASPREVDGISKRQRSGPILPPDTQY